MLSQPPASRFQRFICVSHETPSYVLWVLSYGITVIRFFDAARQVYNNVPEDRETHLVPIRREIRKASHLYYKIAELTFHILTLTSQSIFLSINNCYLLRTYIIITRLQPKTI